MALDLVLTPLAPETEEEKDKATTPMIKAVVVKLAEIKEIANDRHHRRIHR